MLLHGENMNINIKASQSMNANKTTNYENNFLRIPEDYRIKHKLEIGEFVNFRNVNGGSVTLQIAKAYISDMFSDPLSAYVTDEVFEIINLDDSIEVVNDITLGADPEYFLIDKYTGKLIDASSKFNKWGEVGCDGLLGEIRPLPSIDPNIVVTNIGKLLARAKKSVGDNISMMAASYFKEVPAGFHLHFGIPKRILGKKPETGALINSIVRSFDYYLAPLGVVMEGGEESGRRSAPFLTYGKVSDYRIDCNTLEYRVPGGCFLKHPIFTKGLLSLGAVIIEDAVSRYKSLTNGFKEFNCDIKPNDIYPNIPCLTDLFSMMCTPDSSAAKRHITVIREDVQKMLGYNKRSCDINKLFDNIETSFSNNIDINWKLEQTQLKHFNMVG